VPVELAVYYEFADSPKELLSGDEGENSIKDLSVKGKFLNGQQALTTPCLDDTDEEWGEFLHKPGIKYHNFENLRDEIVAETDRKTISEGLKSKRPRKPKKL